MNTFYWVNTEHKENFVESVAFRYIHLDEISDYWKPSIAIGHTGETIYRQIAQAKMKAISSPNSTRNILDDLTIMLNECKLGNHFFDRLYHKSEDLPVLKYKDSGFIFIDGDEYEEFKQYEADGLKFEKESKELPIDNFGNTQLMITCGNRDEKKALELINEYGDKCKPEQVNFYSNTALILACMNNLNNVAIKLIETFGEKCKPKHNNNNDTALFWACHNRSEKIVIKLIETFSDIDKDIFDIYEYTRYSISDKDYLRKIKDEINFSKIDEINLSKIDEDGNTELMVVCRNGDETKALELINKFGDKCKPEQVNKKGDIILIRVCRFKLENVAIKLIETFGDKCKPNQINCNGNTALFWACRFRLEKVVIKLIETFGDKCQLIGDFNNSDMKYIKNIKDEINLSKIDEDEINISKIDENGNTELMVVCRNGDETKALELINKFGDRCKPEQLNNRKQTALMFACLYDLGNVAIKLIETFGDKCKPEQVDIYGESALISSCNEKLWSVATKLIETFGDKCQPSNAKYNDDNNKFIKYVKDKINKKKSITYELMYNHPEKGKIKIDSYDSLKDVLPDMIQNDEKSIPFIMEFIKYLNNK
jgi:ankyrin repeat protein